MSLRSGHQYRHQQKASFFFLYSTFHFQRVLIFHLPAAPSIGRAAPPSRARSLHHSLFSTAIKKKHPYRKKNPLLTTQLVSLFFLLLLHFKLVFPFPLRTALPGLEHTQTSSKPTCICLHTENALSSQTIQHIITAPLALASPLKQQPVPLLSAKKWPPDGAKSNQPPLALRLMPKRAISMAKPFAISSAAHSTHSHRE